MHVQPVLTTSFLARLFWTSVLCISDPEHRDASVLILCFSDTLFRIRVGLVKIFTEVGNVGEIQIKCMGYFLMIACSTLAAVRMNECRSLAS